MLKDIIIKNITNSTSSIVDLPYVNNFDRIKLINILQNDYIKFNPDKETIIINGKNIDDTSINDIDLRKSVYIFSKKNSTTFEVNDLKSQYDSPYNIITNQCSWVSNEFLNTKDIIYKYIINNDINNIKNIYNICMHLGTNKRKQYGKLIQGENIDELNLDSEIKSTVYGNSMLLNFIDSDVVKMIVKPNIKKFSYDYFLNEIQSLINNKSIIINRDGETFVFHKVNDKYYVFDSHKRNIYEYDFNKLINYILKNNKDGFFYILWSVK
jgi:hypothetical protein